MSAQQVRIVRSPAWRLAAALLVAGSALRAQTVPPHNHVVVVALENHSYESSNNGIVGASAAPWYNNTLIANHGLATAFYANGHDSLLEYFWMIDGQPNCSSSGTYCGGNPTTLVADADSLIREVIAAGKSWKQYTDSLPSRGFIVEESSGITGSNPTGTYFARHAPAIYLSDVRQGTPTNQAVDCTGEPNGYDAVKQACNVVNFQDSANGFQADLAAGRLPNFSLIVPNGCNDAHSCGIGTADAWLQANLDPLLQSSYFQPGGDGLLIVWWDEGSLTGYAGSCGGTQDNRSSATSCTGGGGRVAVALAAPDLVSPGFQSAVYHQHPSLTRTVAQALGITVPAAASAATAMGEFFGTPASLPAPWQHADVGTVDVAGSASAANGTFTITAGGTDIWDTADAFHYVYQPLTGDGEIVADVTGLTLPSGAAFSLAGVMIREKLTANAIHASMMITTQGKAKFRRRTTEGGITASDGPSTGSTFPPRWLKLSRVGNDFSAYVSDDGTAWTQIFTTQTVPMASTVYIGFLALRNGSGTAAATATFANVGVRSLPSPWQGADVGAVDLHGSASATSGTFTVNAGGTDIWDTADAFYYVYRPLAGDGTIVADVTGLTLPSGAAFSLAGVMIREKLTANAVHASMMITTQGKAKFRRRTTEGGITASDGPSTGSTFPPRWLKLTRAANDFSAYVSDDGTTWTQIFSTQTVAMSSNAYVGFLVLRNGAGTPMATGTFSHVTVSP